MKLFNPKSGNLDRIKIKPFKLEKEIQILTDNQIKQIELTSEKKEKEIMIV